MFSNDPLEINFNIFQIDVDYEDYEGILFACVYVLIDNREGDGVTLINKVFQA